MKALVQRVSEASVEVNGEIVAAIDRGLMVLLGVARSDSHADALLNYAAIPRPLELAAFRMIPQPGRSRNRADVFSA